MKQSTKNNANYETYFVVLEMLSNADKRGNGIGFTSLNHYDLMVMIDGGVKFADFKNALDEWLDSLPNGPSKLSPWATIREAALFSSATRLNMLEEED